MLHEFKVQIAYRVPSGTMSITHTVRSTSLVGALQAALRMPLPDDYMESIQMGIYRTTIRKGRLVAG